MIDARTLTREERRQRMPIVSAFVGDFAAEFGKVTLLHAEEGGLTWGAALAENYTVSVADMECYALHQQGEGARSGSRLESRQQRQGARVQASVLSPAKGETGRPADVSRVADRGAK